VLDTNRLIAALLRDGVTRRIIERLPDSFITVEQAIRTVESYSDELLERTTLDVEEFDLLLAGILLSLDVVPETEYQARLPDAEQLIGDVDPEDVPFLALALAKGAPIWTDDKHFRRQNAVRVISTAEFVAKLQEDGRDEQM